MASVVVDLPRQSRRHNHRYEDDYDSHEYDNSITTIAAPYTSPRDYEYRESSMRGALVRPTVPHVHAPTVASTVIEEPVIEHEHHHLHHHIDHGDVSGRAALSRVSAGVHSHSRPSLGREYSYDDLDLRERRYANGTTVSTIHRAHEHPAPSVGHRRRHRHRHRGRHGESIERTRISRSDIDLTVTATNDRYDSPMFENDDVTVVDVPPGTKRVYVNVDKNTSGGHYRERDTVDWRREHGVRRSRGLGNELWTEITKDLVTREAIEDCGYPFEETEYFYYIFEYLDRDQIAELRELTDEIRHERVRDIEYQSIAGSTPRVIPSGRSDYDDTRTEIVIESASQRGGSGRRRYYY